MPQYVPRISMKPLSRTRLRNPPQGKETAMRRVGAMRRHAVLWFEDGDIAITAPMPDGRKQGYRVHKDVFVNHSIILKDIFHNTEQGLQCPPTYDHVPCVELLDNSADVESFIFAMYRIDEPYIFETYGVNATEMINGALCMASKYLVKALGTKLREFYISQWPRTLDMWDAEEDLFDQVGSEYVDDEARGGKYAEDFSLHEPASAIRLARQLNIPEILPTAFYHLMRISWEDDWTARRSQKVVVGPQYFSAYSRTARWDLVSDDNMAVLFNGCDQVNAFLTNVWAPAVASCCSSACIDPVCCSQINMQAITSLLETVEDETTSIDPLRMLRRKFDRDIDTICQNYLVCETCAIEIQRVTLETREYLWEMLPQIFGLASVTSVPLSKAMLEVFYHPTASGLDLSVFGLPGCSVSSDGSATGRESE